MRLEAGTFLGILPMRSVLRGLGCHNCEYGSFKQTNYGLLMAVLVAASTGAQDFSDNFARGLDPGPTAPWSVQSGSWTVTGGLMNAGPNLPYGYLYSLLETNWVNYEVEARVRLPAGAYGGGIGGRLNPAAGSHYAAWLYPENSGGGSNLLKLIKFRTWTSFGYTNVDLVPMAQASLSAVGTNWNTLKLGFNGNQITALFNGSQVIQVTDVEAQPLAAGGLSLDMFTGSTPYAMAFDDVVVYLRPEAKDDAFSVKEGRTLNMAGPGVLSNDVPGSGQFYAVLSSDVAHGSLTLVSNGGFSYQPAPGYIGLDSFTYRAGDNRTNSAPATVFLTIYSNSPPAANADAFVLTMNRPFAAAAPGVLANDTDSDSDPLTAKVISNVQHGSLTLASEGSFDYIPNPGYSGADSFTYVAHDGMSGSALATVSLWTATNGSLFIDSFVRPFDPGTLAPWIVRSGTWQVSGGDLQGGSQAAQSYGAVYATNSWRNYAVSARLRLPIGAYGAGVGGRVDPATGAHYAAWIYPENSPGGANIVKLIKFNSWTTFGYGGMVSVPMAQAGLPAVGTNWHTVKLAFQDRRIAVYVDESMLISMRDQEATYLESGGCSIDMWSDVTPYSINVTEVAVDSLSVGEAWQTPEDAPLVIAAPGLLANDTSVYGSNLTALLVFNPTNGILNLQPSGAFTYAPFTNFFGVDAFAYETRDGTNSLGGSWVTINVSAVNDPPVLPSVSNQELAEGATLTVTNTASDLDLPAQSLTYVLVSAPSGATIDPGGVITWTPTEAQDSGTNVFATIVTDSGNPPLSVTNTFTVVVTEVNSTPALGVMADQRLVELATLSVTNAASDSDLPAQTLTYSLVIAPAGAMIDADGVITWSPTEAQGPATNLFSTVVTDNGNPPLSVTNTFTVVVTEVNSAPVLVAIPDQQVAELTTLTVTNAANDSDLPAGTLTYALVNAPAGAVIDANGVISWTPTEAQGPATNLFSTVATDSGNPPLSVTNTFTVVVTQVNSAPVLVAIPDQQVAELTTLTVTNAANDLDLPAGTLTYALLNAPAGAVIDANGVITWTPTDAQGPATNVIETVVTDDGNPPLS